MKKYLFVAFFLCYNILTLHAQLNVYSSGKVGVNTPAEFRYAKLAIGKKEDTEYSQFDFNLFSRNKVDDGRNYYIGFNSDTYPPIPKNFGRAIGVRGIAGSTTSGYNYGVLGSVQGTQNGAGIFGTTTNVLGVYVPGRYAGYFDGETRVVGSLTATSFITPSDIRLKENVILLDGTKSGNTIDRVKNLSVVSYNYKSREYEDLDTASATTLKLRQLEEKSGKERHIGLIAQELREVLPELVTEGQDGYLGVNYTEMVPILLRCIQELKEQIDDLRGTDNEGFIKNAPSATANVGHALLPQTAALTQNSPNPFTERTVIRFTLPEDANNAYIYIFDMLGKMLKQMPVDATMSSVTINGYELSAGLYIYSLVVNGKEVDAKRMILSK